MNENKVRRAGIHVAFWILYFSYETINAAWGERDDVNFEQIHKVWANIPLIVCAVYVNLYVLMPRYLYSKRYAVYGVALLGLILVWAFVTRYLGYQFWLAWDKE